GLKQLKSVLYGKGVVAKAVDIFKTFAKVPLAMRLCLVIQTGGGSATLKVQHNGSAMPSEQYVMNTIAFVLWHMAPPMETTPSTPRLLHLDHAAIQALRHPPELLSADHLPACRISVSAEEVARSKRPVEPPEDAVPTPSCATVYMPARVIPTQAPAMQSDTPSVSSMDTGSRTASMHTERPWRCNDTAPSGSLDKRRLVEYIKTPEPLYACEEDRRRKGERTSTATPPHPPPGPPPRDTEQDSVSESGSMASTTWVGPGHPITGVSDTTYGAAASELPTVGCASDCTGCASCRGPPRSKAHPQDAVRMNPKAPTPVPKGPPERLIRPMQTMPNLPRVSKDPMHDVPVPNAWTSGGETPRNIPDMQDISDQDMTQLRSQLGAQIRGPTAGPGPGVPATRPTAPHDSPEHRNSSRTGSSEAPRNFPDMRDISDQDMTHLLVERQVHGVSLAARKRLRSAPELREDSRQRQQGHVWAGHQELGKAFRREEELEDEALVALSEEALLGGRRNQAQEARHSVSRQTNHWTLDGRGAHDNAGAILAQSGRFAEALRHRIQTGVACEKRPRFTGSRPLLSQTTNANERRFWSQALRVPVLPVPLRPAGPTCTCAR
ncbi:unnamed protein product, partial [Polarella glacialis]